VPYPSGIDVFSVPVKHIATTIGDGMPKIEAHSKLRIFLDRNKYTVKFSPVIVTRWNPHKNNIDWLTPRFQKVWEMTLKKFEIYDWEDSLGKTNEDMFDALFSLIGYAASSIVFADIWSKFLRVAWEEFITDPAPLLTVSDLSLAFGPQLAESLLPLDTENLVKERVASKSYNRMRYQLNAGPSRSKSIQNRDLFDQCLTATNVHGGKFLIKRASLEENLIRMFVVLRKVIDEMRRPHDTGGGRLREGFPFSDILNICRSWKTEFKDSEASLLADCLIDQGIMVPVAKDIGSSWQRVYRAGESVDSSRITKTKILSLEGMRLWDETNPKKPLSELDLNKILVILSEMFPDELPLDKRADVYGFRPYLGNQEVVSWLISLNLLSFSK